MEIDFLGLNSPNYTVLTHHPSNNHPLITPPAANGGVETSLSLCTTHSLQTDILNFPKKKKMKWCENKIQKTAPFLYDLNDNPTTLRNICELQQEGSNSLTMMYSSRGNGFKDSLPEKADKAVFGAGKASVGMPAIGRNGYTPTVAMARRATLARFLEKRLHRMNQASTSHLIGKSLDSIESETSSRSINKKINNFIRL